MPNHLIPITDKQTVVQRLAEGQSTRQAIEGTAIKSNQTAARIAKTESHAIAQLRENYVKQINYYAQEGQTSRAALLADMMWADKVIRIPLPKGARYLQGMHKSDSTMTVPDWDMRLKAIKYIDHLAGLTPGQGTQVNMVQMNHSR